MPEHVSHAIARYLSMLTWIGRQPERRTTVGELAAHFGRNLRQIENDLRNLALFRDSLPGESFELNWFEPQKGTSTAERLTTSVSVRSTRGLDLPPSFTDEEVATIIVGLRMIAPLLSQEDQQEIPPTVMALEAMSASRAHLHESILEIPRSETHEALHLLHQAITTSRIVTFTYTAHNHVVTQRRVDPLALSQGSSGWQLHGWCHDAHAQRLFIVSRIRDLHLSDDSFRPTSHTLQHDEAMTLRITLGRDAQWVGESYASAIIAQDAQTVTFEMPVWDRQWVRDLLTRVASSVYDLDDPELLKEIRENARDILSVWDQVDIEVGGTLET